VVFAVMATLAQMELEIKRERVNDSGAVAAKPIRGWCLTAFFHSTV
jgi:DNA invertase Pin-like site-specific DNA recombinase